MYALQYHYGGVVLLMPHRLDPVQVTQMAKYLETVYISGWQSSSTASSSNEPGPDLAGESNLGDAICAF